MTTESIAEEARTLWEHCHAKRSLLVYDLVPSALSAHSSDDLIDYVDSLSTWDDGYSEDAVAELARRAGIDTEDYDSYDDIWTAITAHFDAENAAFEAIWEDE